MGNACSQSIGVRGNENLAGTAVIRGLSGGGDLRLHSGRPNASASGFVTVVQVPEASIIFRQDPVTGGVKPEEIARACRDYLKRAGRRP